LICLSCLLHEALQYVVRRSCADISQKGRAYNLGVHIKLHVAVQPIELSDNCRHDIAHVTTNLRLDFAAFWYVWLQDSLALVFFYRKKIVEGKSTYSSLGLSTTLALLSRKCGSECVGLDWSGHDSGCESHKAEERCKTHICLVKVFRKVSE